PEHRLVWRRPARGPDVRVRVAADRGRVDRPAPAPRIDAQALRVDGLDGLRRRLMDGDSGRGSVEGAEELAGVRRRGGRGGPRRSNRPVPTPGPRGSATC